MSLSIVDGLVVVEDFGTIRVNGEGQMSVYDLIRVCCISKERQYPHYTWKRLTVKFPEVLSKVRNFKFEGAGQKATPICNKEAALEILGLLPGTTGAKYRAVAAKLVAAFLENPDQVAIAAIDRIKDKDKLEEVTNKALNKYISTYHPLMGEIRKRDGVSPVTYQHVNSVNTKAIMGKEPHLVKAERGGKTARENATSDELMHLYVLQGIQQKGLQHRNAIGHSEIAKTIQDAADDFQDLLGKYGATLQQLS